MIGIADIEVAHASAGSLDLSGLRDDIPDCVDEATNPRRDTSWSVRPDLHSRK